MAKKDLSLIPIPQDADVWEMDREALENRIQDLNVIIDKLNGMEPRNEESEEYEQWADRHELLEDLLDEAIDALEDLNG